ncbi:AraC family transcriptional regulator [Vitreoscilla massiliensis]|uniref:AraC family transcriptional regulator n=1 Tax=Vitreoscilla massiliensis TaxID=1689272 RepID=A0ABY4E737_9NEIS|nr:AraC family transcriptional regulator [Vitreoscilla massiliensis]UOO91153.1 AraC family transcriptional regulator [Vitreoscilla massiliensis]
MSHHLWAADTTLYQDLAQLRSVADNCLRFSAQQDHAVRAVAVARPLLTVVLHGSKCLEHGHEKVQVGEGEVLLISQACNINVRNQINATAQCYASLCIPLPENVLQAARLLYGQAAMAATMLPIVDSVPVANLAAHLSNWAQAVWQQQPVQAHLALTQLVLQLVQQGHHALLLPAPQELHAQIAAWVHEQPAHPWQSTEVEARLNMSAATLRRRLAKEGHSLKQVILHARLNCALDMLYTQTWPLKTIAAKCGYQSESVFKQRFEQRFGLSPEQIRAA